MGLEDGAYALLTEVCEGYVTSDVPGPVVLGAHTLPVTKSKLAVNVTLVTALTTDDPELNGGRELTRPPEGDPTTGPSVV